MYSVFVCFRELVFVCMCAHGGGHRASTETKGFGNVSNTSCGFPFFAFSYEVDLGPASMTAHFLITALALHLGSSCT